jgi:putative tricarboxylic transport membrane protein
MESHVLEMALRAAEIVFDPTRLGFVALGVLIGLSLGVIPGLGGIVGLSLLLPFTFGMDPFTALAFLVGLQSVVVTSDTIPAILFGVPGTVGSAATILDGHPMAKKGMAARAFGAAFSSSVLGGLCGALFLAFSVPILRPLILSFGTPELLAFCVFGLSLVGVLSGRTAMKGLAAAAIGLMIATTGEEPNTATDRWTFGLLYLLDGFPIVPVALGLFALPEMADMVIAGKALPAQGEDARRWGQLEGIKDTLSHLFLVVRGSAIGAFLGAVPGIGATVIDWIAYGHALRTEKGASESFGQGDVRGVIASESSNNAKEGGALITTIAFGVPATASMALLLGAFLIQGVMPGPDMLTTRLDVTYTLAWTVAIANVLGAGICFAFANQLAAIARIRIGILAPVVLSVTFIGAFQGARQWGDIITLLCFGGLGWIMKRVNWPRPPLLLGLVLGALIERYMFISFQRYGTDWLFRPVVIGVLAVTLFGILRPLLSGLASRRDSKRASAIRFGFQRGKLDADAIFSASVIAFFAVCVVVSSKWEFAAKLVPQVVGWAGMLFAGWQLFSHLFLQRPAEEDADTGAPATFDVTSDFAGLSKQEVRRRAAHYFGWCLGLFIAATLIGLLPATLLFLAGYMHFEGKERWGISILIALLTWSAWYVLFDLLLAIPWPPALLGNLVPALRAHSLTNLL